MRAGDWRINRSAMRLNDLMEKPGQDYQTTLEQISKETGVPAVEIARIYDEM